MCSTIHCHLVPCNWVGSEPSGSKLHFICCYTYLSSIFCFPLSTLSRFPPGSWLPTHIFARVPTLAVSFSGLLGLFPVYSPLVPKSAAHLFSPILAWYIQATATHFPLPLLVGARAPLFCGAGTGTNHLGSSSRTAPPVVCPGSSLRASSFSSSFRTSHRAARTCSSSTRRSQTFFPSDMGSSVPYHMRTSSALFIMSCTSCAGLFWNCFPRARRHCPSTSQSA